MQRGGPLASLPAQRECTSFEIFLFPFLCLQTPTLAVARGSLVRVLAISPDDGHTTTLALATLPDKSDVVALHWLGQHILAVITSEHRVWMMDATLKVLDRVALTEPRTASCSMADKTIILSCSQVRKSKRGEGEPNAFGQ